MDANTRTGTRRGGDGESDRQVLGAYRRAELNGSGKKLLAFAGEHNLELLDTLFCKTLKRGISYTSKNAQCW